MRVVLLWCSVDVMLLWLLIWSGLVVLLCGCFNFGVLISVDLGGVLCR